jgi:hypothetical protein
MKQNKMICVLMTVCILISQFSYSQKSHILSFGLNATHISDWVHKPLYFFNPEIRYTKILPHNNAIDIGINAFYGTPKPEDLQKIGDKFSRLIFSIDVGFKKYFNHFSAVIGPSLRYRNEVRAASCPSCDNGDILIDSKRGFVDFGGMIGVNYEIPINGKSSIGVRTAYRAYNKGASPISLGLFYNKRM